MVRRTVWNPKRGERGPDYLLYLPAVQPRLEKPHPQAFYTSGLTSPIILPIDMRPMFVYYAF
jgi:hypothetical protein